MVCANIVINYRSLKNRGSAIINSHSEFSSQPPQTFIINNVTKTEMLTLFGVLFDNSICVYVYQKEPKTGSFSIGMPTGDSITVFAGKNEIYSESLGKILARSLKKGVYSSVFLEKNSKLTISDIGIIAKKFISELEKLESE